jgi:hypothetical protein
MMAYREVSRYDDSLVNPHPTRAAKPTVWHRYEQLPVYGKCVIFAFLLTVAILLAAIPVHPGNAEDACLIFGTILGGSAAFMTIPGFCEFDSKRYQRRLKQAAYTHKLPEAGSVYEAIPVGEYVQIWEGNRANGWKQRHAFHAEEENEKAMEVWNSLQNSNAVNAPAPEASALAKTLNGERPPRAWLA